MQSLGLDPYLHAYGNIDNTKWLILSKDIARLESSKCGRNKYNKYNRWAKPLTTVTDIRNKIGLNRNNKNKNKSQTDEIKLEQSDSELIGSDIDDVRGCCDVNDSLPIGFDISCDECLKWLHEECIEKLECYTENRLSELRKQVRLKNEKGIDFDWRCHLNECVELESRKKNNNKYITTENITQHNVRTQSNGNMMVDTDSEIYNY